MKETEKTEQSLSQKALAGLKAPPPDTINTIGLLQRTGNGDFTAECDHLLKKIIAAISEIQQNESRDCSGSLQINIKFKTFNDAIVNECSVTGKMPASKPIGGLIYGDEDGVIYNNDPHQKRFDFR